jgi:hypothetical protein
MTSALAVNFPVAKKFHRCSCCNGPIEKGERYRRWTGRSDLWIGLATEKRCKACCERYGNELPT